MVGRDRRAEDLPQEFFLHFLESHALGHVRPHAAKFRSFLLACLKNSLANERERPGLPPAKLCQ
jgi:DNA-directed RNA polymerase specialized sigma24 family protein